MKGVVKLYEIIKKNLKIVFRSWTTTFLLIIAPLLLILILGFAFGGSEVHDVKLGTFSNYPENVDQILPALESDQVEIISYRSLEACQRAIMTDDLHVCAEFSDNFHITSEKASGTITFHLDNSKLNLVPYLTEYLKEKIGDTTDQITLEATEQILGDIQDSVVFMMQTQDKLDLFIGDALAIRSQMITTKKEVEQIKSEFDVVYVQIKRAEREGHFETLEKSIEQLSVNTTVLNQSIETTLGVINQTKGSIDSFTNSTGGQFNVSVVITQLDLLETQLIDLQDQITAYHTLLEANRNYVEAIPKILERIEEVNVFLETVITQTDENIVVLDTAIQDMQTVSRQLDASIDKFSELDEDQASSLLKPITTIFSPLLKDKDKVTLIFPVILVFIISFIAILLSNITVLNEVNSPANFRNYLVPVSSFSFIFGLYVTNLLVVLFQILILLLVAAVRFKINMLAVLPELIITIVLISSVFVLMGMFIGYIIRSQQTAILLSVFIALGTFLFSDVIFPVEIMPELATTIASNSPLVMGERMFRQLLYYNVPLSGQLADLFTIVVYLIILSVLTYYGFKYNKRKS